MKDISYGKTIVFVYIGDKYSNMARIKGKIPDYQKLLFILCKVLNFSAVNKWKIFESNKKIIAKHLTVLPADKVSALNPKDIRAKS